MLLRRLALAGMMGVAAVAAAAQDLRPPRELPPPGFKGQQYTDSGGCVFLRAGLAGRTNWVPRIGPDRRQMCGLPPSFAPEPEVVEAPAPRPAAQTEPVQAAQAPAPRPARAAAPAPVAEAPAAVQATRGCPDRAPHGQRVQRADGSVALYCAVSPARLAAAVAEAQAPQRAPAPAPVATRSAAAPSAEPVPPPERPGILPDVRIVCPAAAPNPRRVALADGSSTILCAGPDGDVQTAAAGLRRNGLTFAPIVPPGYRFAWEDDRLNPRRGQGTVDGQIAQDRVWTRDVPARLVAAPPPQTTTLAASGTPQTKVTVSAANRAKPQQAAGRILVQVGSFGVPANADAARGRLAAMGLPVAGGRATIGGKPVQVVFAGPFATAAEARKAVAAARSAGFADAFIR
jgi:hypothetical protein